ncbi:MAG: exo-beta-N-acetylmuramidase NamZ domain-containing protein [Candidatus Saccharimonadaceae bacterium]
MKITRIFILLCIAMMATTTFAQKIKIKTGIEVLKETNFKVLQNKRVGLITNPTGVDNNLKSTIDILHEAPNVNLVALYGPEHGVRGDVHAGDKVDTFTDPNTGVPVYSLYGATRKPTAEMLQGLDVLVYDIQDIGCRSYTYISTMYLAMQAAAENNIAFVVLDRPNPVGGLKVEGNLAEDGFISFVSQLKIPYLYGLTCGELALMINKEMMGATPCQLDVVKMKKWKRKMKFEDTNLQWVPASPHIPFDHSAIFYPVSGIVGELGYMSIGVGYTLPFEMFAAEWINAEEFARALNVKNLPGVKFRPIHLKPFYSVGKGENLQGVQVHLMDFEKARLSDIQFHVMEVVAELYPDKAVFDHADKGRFDMFDKVSGSDYIRLEFSKNNKFSDIRSYWMKDETSFKNRSKKYYLYK